MISSALPGMISNELSEYDDTISMESSDGGGSASGHPHLFKSQRSVDHAQVLHQTNSGSGESASSGSMLVAENGFVRFRPLEEINGSNSSGGRGDNVLNMHSPTINKASMVNGRHKDRLYNNS